MLKLKSKKIKELFLYVAMFWLLYVADSMMFALNSNGTVMRFAQLSQLIIGFTLVFFIIRKKVSIDFLVLILVSGTILLTGFLISDSINIALRKIAVLITGYYLARCADTKKLINTYCNVMLFIALISLIAFTLPDVAISISFPPRLITSTRQAEFVTLFFTNIPVNSWNQTRNWGPFWEPGAYQAFLNLALIFTLFIRKTNTKFKILSTIIFTIAVITTLSTTGYLAMFFIFIAYIFNKKKSSALHTLVKIMIVCFFFVSATYIVFRSGLFESVVIDKLQNEETSRYQFVFYGIKAFLESPIIGNGAELSSVIVKLAGSDISRTNTFVAMFAIFGFIPGIYTIICYFKTFINFRKVSSILSAIFIGVAICCLLFGEYFIYSPIFAWLMFLIPDDYNKKKQRNSNKTIVQNKSSC